MPIGTLTKRLVKGLPLTASEGDANLTAIENFVNAQEARMDVSLNSNGTLKKPNAIAVVAGSGTDAYTASTIDFSGTLAELNGVVVIMRPDVANTGAATFKLNSLAACSIKKYKDQDLTTNDIKPQSYAVMVYNSNLGVFELLNPQTTPRMNYIADSGTAAAYVLNTAGVVNFSEPDAYYDGYTVWFKALNTNTAGATLKVGSLGAVNMCLHWINASNVAQEATLPAKAILAGELVQATYLGGNFYIFAEPKLQTLNPGQFSYAFVSSAGAVQAGGVGLSCSRTATGTYAFTFDAPYTPRAGVYFIVQATLVDVVNGDEQIWVASQSTAGFTVRIARPGVGNANSAFAVLVIDPQ